MFSRISCFIFSFFIAFSAQAQSITYGSLFDDASFAKTIDLSKPVGSIEGSAGTSPTGAATYTIPLKCPPGTGTVVPSLALVYNSQSGNGLLGQGWSLAGLSLITRAGWDNYHHAKAAPVSYTNNDAFVLDGSYLYPKSGTYGAGGTTYSTEGESYSVTTSYGSFGGGPEYFKVVGKDGSMMFFGNTTDSRFLSDDATKVMMWRLNRIQDPNGNYIDFVYDNSNRESRLIEIKYTGNVNTGLAPYFKISFNYAQRDDKNTMYDGAYSIKSNYLLTTINVNEISTGEMFKGYSFWYGKNNSTSYLKSIYEHNGNGETLNDTRFKYGEETNDVEETINYDVITLGVNTNVASGDFDGDGLSDLLVSEYALVPGSSSTVYNTNLKIKKRTNLSTVYTTPVNITLGGTGVRVENIKKESYFTQRKIIPQMADFNGDGRDDIIISNYNTFPTTGGGYVNILDYIQIYYTNSDATLPSSPSFTYTPPPASSAIIKGGQGQENYFFNGDFDGDGRADFITMLGGTIYFHSPSKGIANKAISQINLSGGSLSGAGLTLAFDLLFKQADEIFVVNMDGDAKSELMTVTDGTTRIFTFNFDAVLSDLHMNQIGNDLGYPTTRHHISLGDFNGDGKTDILTGPCPACTPSNVWQVAYSNGSSFVNPQNITFDHSIILYERDPFGCTDNIVIGDYNGDGKYDIYNSYINGSVNNHMIFYSTGIGFDLKTHTKTRYYGKMAVGDYNGDGRMDNFVYSNAINPEFQYFNPFDKSHFLQKVTDGFNRTTEFSYEPLTKGTGTGSGDFYTKGTGEVYPVNNVQFPMYVTTAFTTIDGIGGFNTTNYKYNNLRLHRGGRGLLGFEKVTAINSINNIKTESTFDLNRAYYFTYPKTTKTYLNSSGIQLSQSDNNVTYTMSATALRAGGAHAYRQTSASSETQDLLKGVQETSSTTLDSYGNPTSSTSSTLVGGSTVFTSSSSNTYIAVGGYGIPNKLLSTTSTQQRTGQPAISTQKDFVYNSRGLITQSESLPLGTASPFVYKSTSTMDYDAYGNLIYETKSQHGSSLSPYTRYEYDSKGRFVTVEENTLGHKKYITTHKFWGKASSETDFNGLTSNYSYDNWGKLISATIPTSPSSFYTISYTEDWDLDPSQHQYYTTLVQDPSAPDVKTWYDQLGRPIRAKTEAFGSAWVEAKTSYDARGNTASSTNTYLPSETPKISTHTYDEYNRLLSVSDPVGTTHYAYSLGGGELTTSITMPDGKVHKTTEDAIGSIIKSYKGAGSTLHYKYDSRGQEIEVAMGSWTTTYGKLVGKEYDPLGHLKKMEDKDAGTYQYNYDTWGQLRNSTDPKSVITSYQYDIMGRPVLSTMSKAGLIYTTEYSYYGPEKEYEIKEQKVTGPDGLVTDVYDYFVGGGTKDYIRNINGVCLAKQFGYDAFNRLTTTTYTNGLVTLPTGSAATSLASGFGTTRHYDANGFVTKITTNDPSPKTLYEALAMNGQGQVTEYKRLGGLNSSVAYQHNLPTHFYTPGQQDLQMSYDYRNANLHSRNDARLAGVLPNETFEYDNQDRLTKGQVATVIGGISSPISYPALTMSYDNLLSGTLSLGRIMAKSDVGTYTYSGYPSNAVKTINLAPGSTVISHETQNITYNHFDKTQKITEQVGPTFYEEQMLYDADQDRAYTQQSRGASAGSLSHYRKRWYMGDYEQQEIGANTQHIHYINSDGGLVAIVVKDAGGYQYYSAYTDHLGSIVRVTNETGSSTQAQQNYDAWGRERNPETWDYDMFGAAPKPDWLYRGYTGHEMLPEYGLINMNGRMYDPTNGRMLRPDNYIQDPLNPQNYNRYSYCWNNPLKYTDPSGDFITWNFSPGGGSIGINFTPIGVPLGFGFNFGVGPNASLGVYGEAGVRVGGTGFGYSSVVSQSFDYSITDRSWTTTTTASASASIGFFNFGGSASFAYNFKQKQLTPGWSIYGGLGVGNSDGGVGAYVSYGSSGWRGSIGGNVRTFSQAQQARATERAVARANRRSEKANQTGQTANTEKAYITFVPKSEAERILAEQYIKVAEAAGYNKAQIEQGLRNKGITVVSAAKGGANLTQSQLKSISSLESQIATHQTKLAEYIKNPMKFDNKGLLKNAPNDAVRQKIIQSRINHLNQEIKTFQNNIQKILNGQ